MSEIKPKEIAEIVSIVYSAGPYNPQFAAKLLDRLARAGVDEDDFDRTDDIISDANEYRKAHEQADDGMCPECGERPGRGDSCEACRIDRLDRTIERDIDLMRGKP